MEWRFLQKSVHSAEPFGHRSPAHLCFFLSVFHFGFHLTPRSPATCLSKPSQLSFYLSLHCSISYSASFCTPTLVYPGLLCQCLWLKCSSRRKEKSKENVLFSVPSSLKFAQSRQFFYFSKFFSWWFLASVTMVLSGCVWITMWYFLLLNYKK